MGFKSRKQYLRGPNDRCDLCGHTRKDHHGVGNACTACWPCSGFMESLSYLGKPMAYWRREASKLVIDGLIRASECDERSIVGALAAERLMTLARQEDPELFEEVLAGRDRYRGNVTRFVSELVDPTED